MAKQLRSALVIFAILTVITGVVYPAVVTLVAQVVFRHEANGSILERDGEPIGSELIGQSFNTDKYFWSRPSVTEPAAYNGASSMGSNFGPTNPAQLDAVKARVEALRKAHPEMGDAPVPVDLVTASGSGLDPHISPAAAEYQIRRIVRVRGLSEDAVRGLVAEHTRDRLLGLLGEPRVNVLKLNLALDRQARR